MKLLAKLDLAVHHSTRPISDRLCSWTGRSNFALARWIMLAGTVLILSSAVTSNWVDGFFGLLWVWICYDHFQRYKRLENHARYLEEHDTIPIELFMEIESLLFLRRVWILWRVLTMCLFLVPPLRTPSLSEWGFSLAVYSQYCALHVNWGGKSIVKRAVESAKAAGRKILDSVPRPAPRPVPVPVNVFVMEG